MTTKLRPIRSGLFVCPGVALSGGLRDWTLPVARQPAKGGLEPIAGSGRRGTERRDNVPLWTGSDEVSFAGCAKLTRKDLAH